MIRVTDLILRNLFSFDEWPVLFPFVNAEAGSTISLENVIIEMDTSTAIDDGELSNMVKQIRNRERPPGFGTSGQNITVYSPEDCRRRLSEWEDCRRR